MKSFAAYPKNRCTVQMNEGNSSESLFIYMEVTRFELSYELK